MLFVEAVEVERQAVIDGPTPIDPCQRRSLRVGDRHHRHIVEFAIQALDRLNRRAALRPHLNVQHAGMIVCRTDAAAHVVSQPSLRAQTLEQSRRKAAAKDIVHDLNREIIRIVAPYAQLHHVNGALVHIIFVDEINSRLRLIELNLRSGIRRTLGPALKRVAQPLLHYRRIEVADDAEDDVVRMHVRRMPIQQVLPRDGVHCGVFWLAGVGIVRAITDLGCLALGNL